MSDEMIVRNCAPTLAGIKTASLFTCQCCDSSELLDSMRKFNGLMGGKGLRMIPLRIKNQRALVYVFRPEKLSLDLRRENACTMLEKRGYCVGSAAKYLAQLKKRLEENAEFPHEIGLFLGYPPEDVQGFIENSSACKCVGCWKVYGDVEAARKIFAKYKKCTDLYTCMYAKGTSIERLAV